MKRYEQSEMLLGVYCGILFDFQTFRRGKAAVCTYDFENPVCKQIGESYPIARVAGSGSEFERARRLNVWLAARLAHRSDFALSEDGQTPQDALSLLGYAFERPEHGINCAAKSLVLTACCLALGIRARRVALYPASPYDEDNHVVTEIYDGTRGKWIMLDPSNGGYVTDGSAPLSVLEMRERFAEMEPVSVVLPRQDPKKLDVLSRRNLETNVYYAKNLFYFAVETNASPAGGGTDLYLVPAGFDVRARFERAITRLVNSVSDSDLDDPSLFDACRSLLKLAGDFNPKFGTTALWDAPADPSRP